MGPKIHQRGHSRLVCLSRDLSKNEQVSECKLSVGDEIRLGTTLLRLEQMGEEAASITGTALLR